MRLPVDADGTCKNFKFNYFVETETERRLIRIYVVFVVKKPTISWPSICCQPVATLLAIGLVCDWAIRVGVFAGVNGEERCAQGIDSLN